MSRYGDQKQDHQLQNNLDSLEGRLIIYFNKTHLKHLRWFKI